MLFRLRVEAPGCRKLQGRTMPKVEGLQAEVILRVSRHAAVPWKKGYLNPSVTGVAVSLPEEFVVFDWSRVKGAEPVSPELLYFAGRRKQMFVGHPGRPRRW
jgi:hypothetical protein